MTRLDLFNQIKLKQSYLCIGLDADIKKIPPFLLNFKDPIFEFNKRIIESTGEFCVAYKLNIAFYEALGKKGWETLEKTIELIPENILTIADAKRGDIGNTSALYARAFFDKSSSGLEFDGITVAPYMGEDSITPFLSYKDKWIILLALTSNKGSDDFQNKKFTNGNLLYQEVIEKSKQWASPDQIMYVVGATKADKLKEIRKIIPEHFLLVPGVGAQGGSLQEVSEAGLNKQCGLLVNSSRNIIYASQDDDFASKAAEASKSMQLQMKDFLNKLI